MFSNIEKFNNNTKNKFVILSSVKIFISLFLIGHMELTMIK